MTRKALRRLRFKLSRRRMLQGTAAIVATGCGDDGGTTGDTDSGTGGTSSSTSPSSSSAGSSSGDATTSGGSTGSSDDGSGSGSDGSAGSSSSGTTGTTELTPEELLAPIEHIIVLCMENRSFDHYLGAMQLDEGNGDVDGLTGDETNPDQSGDDVAVFEMDNFTPEDPPHSWNASHQQWNDGNNDGFVQAHLASNGDAVKHEVMGYHVREHLPVTYALADNYAVCDRWFCSLLGPTWPNRYYLHCATSNGRIDNTPASPLPRSIMDACDDAGITNRNYFDGLAAWRWGGFPLSGFASTTGIGEFFDKLEAGAGLEQFVILDPDFLANDDHPSHDIQLGQALIASVYEALAQSDYWESSLLVITYDEHGGFFDHVPPPTTTDTEGPEFQQMGFRVPTVVIGPHVRQGAIVNTEFEHSSIAKTVALRFGFEQLNERADASADLSPCIDPAFVDDPQPPAAIPAVDIDEDRVLARAGQFTSQDELFDAVGIEVPLTGAHLEAERRSLRALIDRGRRLGAVKRRRI